MALTPQQIMMALQAQGSGGVGAPTPGVDPSQMPTAMQPAQPQQPPQRQPAMPKDKVKPAKPTRTKLAQPRFTASKRHPAKGGY